jgi:hypothetical protein
MHILRSRAFACALLTAAWAALAAPHYLAWTGESPPPSRLPRSAFESVCDQTPVTLTVTRGWQKQWVVVPAWRVQSDWTLWRTMRFDDWNTVPEPFRQVGLTRMFRRYSRILDGPATWRGMDTADWDGIPSPVRAIAILRMVDAWVAQYAGAARFGIPDRRLSDTIGAIIMVESWFEHAAVNTSPTGNRDLGLAQASDSCRRTLARLARDGAADFTMDEQDYFNPWTATRVATFWLLRLLGQARGDLNLAIRAYHEGIVAARRGAGEEYLAGVLAKRETYMRNEATPPAWTFVFAAARLEPAAAQPSEAAPDSVRVAALRSPTPGRDARQHE